MLAEAFDECFGGGRPGIQGCNAVAEQRSLERNIALEINSSYLRDVPAFLKLGAEINPYVSIGSDVHGLEELGRCRDLLLETMEVRR